MADNVPEPLQFQTWNLRVPIHCEGCKKKVKKILQKIEGVYMTTIDAQQHKVTVTGNIDAQTLLYKLAKSGKPAELWPDKSAKKEKAVDNEEKSVAKNQKPSGKIIEEGGQKKEKKSADNQADPSKTISGGEKSDMAPPVDGDKPLQIEKAGETPGNSDKKKKKKSKGNTANTGNNENLITPTPAPIPPVSVAVAAPAVVPESVPQELPVPAEPVPVQAAAPDPTQAPAPAPAPAPLDSGRPMEPMNHGPSNNFGPPDQGYSQGPYQRTTDHFLPQNQQNYMYSPAHYPPHQLGVSYSMAQPSNSTSYYAPPYYAYDYPQYPMMHIPPPPPLNPIPDDDQYYNDNNASQCRLM